MIKMPNFALYFLIKYFDLIKLILENMIDKEALELLDEESVKEMVVAVGPRRKLLKKLEEEKVYI
jgi:hypothetical protein